MFPHIAHSTRQQQQLASCPQQPRSRAIATSLHHKSTPPLLTDLSTSVLIELRSRLGVVKVSNLNVCAAAVAAGVAPALGALVPVRLSCAVRLGQPSVFEDCGPRLSVSTHAV